MNSKHLPWPLATAVRSLRLTLRSDPSSNHCRFYELDRAAPQIAAPPASSNPCINKQWICDCRRFTGLKYFGGCERFPALAPPPFLIITGDPDTRLDEIQKTASSRKCCANLSVTTPSFEPCAPASTSRVPKGQHRDHTDYGTRDRHLRVPQSVTPRDLRNRSRETPCLFARWVSPRLAIVLPGRPRHRETCH